MKKKCPSRPIGFSKEYWEHNYSDPASMDGVANAREHAQYLKAIFDLQAIEIHSVIDFGFGMGQLFREMLKIFRPSRAYGLEPSDYMFDIVKRRIDFQVTSSLRVKIEKCDLANWCRKNREINYIYDLGICTSVFQYISDAELQVVIPCLAKKCRYLYFSVPTNHELDRQIHDLEFHDTYAIRRSRSRYVQFLKPYFTFVSSRLLESKVHFDRNTTAFTELLFRF